jgi:hypothetical protein
MNGLDFLQAKPDEQLPTLTQRHWNGQFAEIWTYRYINQVAFTGWSGCA